MAIQFVDHTADVAARLSSHDLASLLNESLRALRLAMGIKERPYPEEVQLTLSSQTADRLLIDLLNHAIVSIVTEERIVGAVEVIDVRPERLFFRAFVRTFTSDEAKGWSEIKSATYHELVLSWGPNGSVNARVILDV